MQYPIKTLDGKRGRLLLLGTLAGTGIWLLRRPLLQVAGLVLGGAALAFLEFPAANLFEKRFPRPTAALLGLLSIWGGLGVALWLMLPTLFREFSQLGKSLPQAIRQLSAWLEAAARGLERRFPGISLPQLPSDGLSLALPHLATGAVAVADGVSKFSLMLMLSFFFLCDRDNLLLRLEWLSPQKYRGAVARAGMALARELRLYLHGQLTVAAGVGALTAAGLYLAGMRSALALGGIVGLMNMVPYFGPFIGGIPVVLAALSDGWGRAMYCLGVLLLVQQLDNGLLSPRIMGSVTGFSPATVLLAIYAGLSLGGIGGMLAALPLLMSIRTVYRIFVQSFENI